jgi:hypothetical protein
MDGDRQTSNVSLSQGLPQKKKEEKVACFACVSAFALQPWTSVVIPKDE